MLELNFITSAPTMTLLTHNNKFELEKIANYQISIKLLVNNSTVLLGIGFHGQIIRYSIT